MTTSADILAPGDPGVLEWIGPALPALDYLLPNDEQVLGFTGADELEAGCAALLERGAGCVAATCGGEGALARRRPTAPSACRPSRSTSSTRPAAATPSPPASSAASPLAASRTEAATLGCATAALVAGGLGTDHGDYDLEAADAFAASTPTA